MEDDDDRLIDVPMANLQPGELSRAFHSRAKYQHKRHEEEAMLRSVQVLQYRDAEQQEQQREEKELQTREAAVLQRIHRQQEELNREAEELDERTLKLADGRRAYVDGEDFRDEQGHIMRGADRAEAEQVQLSNPKAATWQEKQQLEEHRHAIEQLERKAEAVQAGAAGPNEAEAVSALERAVAAKQLKTGALPDYGSAASLDLSSLSANFNQTNTGPKDSAIALRQPAAAAAPRLSV